MGYERNPCKYFTEKTAGDGSRVNYIHRDDAVGAIMSLLHAKISNETINVVCPEHPSRAEIWAKCKVQNDTQSRNSREVSKKIIRADRFLEKTKYQFLSPDPLAFKYL
jgi:NAD dependent epimerase/dehydratase family enzyme